MAFRRRRFRRRFRRRRGFRRGMRRSYRRVARSAWRMARTALRRVPGTPEYKRIDTGAVTITPSSTPASILLNGIQTGDTSSTREGIKILIRSVYLRASLNISGAATASLVRCGFIVEKQPYGTAISNTAMLADASASTFSPPSLFTSTRYRWLKQRTLRLDSQGRQQMLVQMFWKGRLVVKFNAMNIGDITDIDHNSLYFWYTSDEAVNLPTMFLYIRVRFVDY